MFWPSIAMNRLALVPVSMALACAIGVAGGCSSRQNRHPAADPPVLARTTPGTTPSASDPHSPSSLASDPPGPASAQSPSPAASDPPASQAAADPPSKGDPASSDNAAQVAEAGSPEGDFSGAIIQEAPAPTPTPGSLASRAVRAAPGAVKNVVLFPYRFFRKSIKEQYSGDGNAAPALVQGSGAGGSASAEEQKFANPSATPKPLRMKVGDTAYFVYDNAEKTIFLPYRILDDAIGLVFAPF